MPTGFLLIDKPAGITSHDVVHRLRRTTGIKKIGHAGTLDPFATGLLIVAVGREATRDIAQFVGMDKVYEAEFMLGATTASLDPEEHVEHDANFQPPTSDSLQAALHTLTGNILQIPPMHSAIKVNGKKLYELARKGVEIEREPRPVTIHQFDLMAEPREEQHQLVLPVVIHCSSGTYIRSLARDLAAILGTVGYVHVLRRTAIGPLSVTEAHPLEFFTPENWKNALRSATELTKTQSA